MKFLIEKQNFSFVKMLFFSKRWPVCPGEDELIPISTCIIILQAHGLGPCASFDAPPHRPPYKRENTKRKGLSEIQLPIY